MKRLFCVFAALLVVSCGQKKADVEVTKMNALDSYPAKTISAVPFNLGDSLLAPRNLRVIDSVMMVQTSNKTGIFHLYSLNSGAPLKAFGNIGRAGNEYLFPRMFQNDAEHIIVSDQMKFDLVDVRALLREERYEPARKDVQALEAVNFLVQIDNSHIVFNSGSGDNQLTFLNLDDGTSVPYNNYPEVAGVPKLNNFIAHTNVFHAITACHEGKIVMAYANYPIIDIVDVPTMKPRRIMFPIPSEYNKITLVDELNADVANPYVGYVDVCVTSNYIYLLYFGAAESAADEMNLQAEIQKFDLDGNLIIRYLPDRFLTTIAVTPDDAQCYAIAFGSDFEEEIVKFQL